MVPLLDQHLALLADVVASLAVDGEIRLEGVVFLAETLNDSHVVSEIRNGHQLLLPANPGFNFNLCEELLESDGFLQCGSCQVKLVCCLMTED